LSKLISGDKSKTSRLPVFAVFCFTFPTSVKEWEALFLPQMRRGGGQEEAAGIQAEKCLTVQMDTKIWGNNLCTRFRKQQPGSSSARHLSIFSQD
jgi:hypothetical protein